jgi:cardiolipin synthase
MYKMLCFLFLFLFTTFSFADELIIEPDAGRAPLLSAINNAKSSVGLVMYGLTDKQFTDALIAAKNKGKTVQILLEPTPYKAEDENKRAIQQLQSHDINLRWPDKTFRLVHQKTFLFDQQYAIVMTFNLTNSSFKRERNFALLIRNPAEVKEIARVFNADFAHQTISVDNAHLVYSPDQSRAKIIDLIQKAKSDIKIYAQDISDYQIIGALAKSARSGIHVEILLSLNPEKFGSGKLNYLRKAGVIIHNNQHFYIHAKVMVIDHQYALLGSINFTKSSLEDNRELSVITEDGQVIKQLLQTFERDVSFPRRRTTVR